MKRVALLGMPNTGKSTLFNRLTGATAKVANWPGMTVDLLAAKTLIGDSLVEIVDLPGVNDLHGFSEDERVVRDFLEHQAVNLIVIVLNAVQIERQLALVLELKELDLPMLVLLNMADEARARGIRIDDEALSAAVQAPVLLVSAKLGQGIDGVQRALARLLRDHPQPRKAATETLSRDAAIEARMERILRDSVVIPQTLSPTLTDRLDNYLLHRWLGIPLLLVILLILFQIVYGIGGPLQDWFSEGLEYAKAAWLTPLAEGLPAWLGSFLLDGVYDGVGTVLTFVPIIALFFMAMAAVEDSGLLARAAFLMDGFMARLGLDGRGFVMQLMGFGCNVPAIMGTRVIRNRAVRLLTMFIIPFSMCSARLQVFIFFTTAVFSPRAAPFVLLTFYVLSMALGFLTALLFSARVRGQFEPLILELPPYRLPLLGYLSRQSLGEALRFVREAGLFILLGVILTWLLTHIPFDAPVAGPDTLAGRLAVWMQPVFSPLGIDALLSIALLFGFVAKEVVIGSLAVIYGAGTDALTGIIQSRLDWVQAYSFMLFTAIYTPCLSTVAVLRRESRHWGFTAAAVAWPLGVAWVVSFVFYQGARALGF